MLSVVPYPVTADIISCKGVRPRKHTPFVSDQVILTPLHPCPSLPGKSQWHKSNSSELQWRGRDGF